MIPLRDLIGGIGISVVILLSSVQFVRLSDDVTDPGDQEFCISKHLDKSSCVADHEHNCVWCKAKAVQSACYDADMAKRLPHSVFTCESSDEDVVELVTE